MAVALRVSSEAFPAIRSYQVIQALVPLTDGLTKPLNCFQGNPLSTLKNWLYNDLPLLVPCTLPVKTHEDQCWEGWEGPCSPKERCQLSGPPRGKTPQILRALTLRISGRGLQLLSPEAGKDGKKMQSPWC